ncbi:MAG: class I SAM-dependent methyltransferase [Armatimonadota bacterium]|nr:class I SAM-dependent methyltransferase [Armatimonadota bacterium]
MAPRSKVEISGQWAPYYDRLMDVLFLGRYPRFMAQVAARMQVKPGDEILDLGSGTGRNAALMGERTGSGGRVVGVDISERMLHRARRRCDGLPQIRFVKRRIEEPLPFAEEFDAVFISFTLHGFEDRDKRRIIANARQALRPTGSLWILDYNEFDLGKMPWPFRWLFRRLECELATEFLTLDLRQMLTAGGFGRFTSHEFVYGYVRLLGARLL